MIYFAEKFQIDHWTEVAGELDPLYSLPEDHKMKAGSTFNSFILYEALKKIYQRHPCIETYEGATDICLEFWEPKKDNLSRLVLNVDGHRYIIAPKIRSWL